MPSDGVEDSGDGVGVLAAVLPLLSPFRLRRRGGREGGSSGALLRPCFSGRPWRRGESSVDVGDLFLLVVEVVVFLDDSALAGRGGEGSGVCW